MTELTWADIDRMNAEREAKRRDVVERLSRILSKEFSVGELRFLFSLDEPALVTEAVEIAKSKAKGGERS